MSVKSDLLELERSRKREAAIREVLRNMQGGSEENLAPVTPEVIEKGIEKGIEISAEATTPELPPYNPATSPARVCKPWESRPGYQVRPLTRRELQAEQDAILDKKALDQLQAYRVQQQRSQDEFELEAKATEKRRSHELRTGRRPLPAPRARGTYIGPAEPTPAAENPWDNRRQFGTFGAT